MLDSKKRKEIDKFLSNIPPISASTSKILEISKKPGVTAIEFNDIIKHDPVLTGKVLKLVNSSYYSLPQTITSLVKAIIMLGINTVKNMVLSSAIINTVSSNMKKQDKNAMHFLEHSICVGTIAKMFCLKQMPDSKGSEEYFVAGLLHDIGKFPLFSVLGEGYNKYYEQSIEQDISMIEMESKEFGINHSELGEKIADIWKLGHQLAHVIRYHHDILSAPEEDLKFTAAITLADIVSIRINKGFLPNRYTETEFEYLLKITEIPYEYILEIESKSEEIIKKSEIFLEI